MPFDKPAVAGHISSELGVCPIVTLSTFPEYPPCEQDQEPEIAAEIPTRTTDINASCFES